jgi:CheY-like chemotaxis protein
MSKSGPIIIVEDDRDDKELFEDITREIGIENELVWFTKAEEAYKYLQTTETAPFLIFSDINLPGINGLEFKRNIDEDPELRRKSIPFVFFSTNASQKDINTAYITMTVQGFFVKGNNYSDMKLLLRSIYFYWMQCKHPNT